MTLRLFRREPVVTPRQDEDDSPYRRLCELSGDIILEEDARGRISSINPGGARLCGHEVEDLLGRPFLDLVAPDDAARARKERHDLLAGRRQIASYEVSLRTRDGDLLAVDIRSTGVWRGGSLTGVQTLARDVTERRRLEAQLRHSQKMEAIGRLAGGVAHDFNNMLTAMMGFAELALGGLEPGHPSAGDIRRIVESGDRAARLVRQLLAFSRRQVLQPSVIDPADVLRPLEAMLRPLIGAAIDLEMRLDADTGRIRVDPSQLTQVLMNLAANARDAMPEGGTLRIETANAAVGKGVRREGVEVVPGNYVKVAVADTGTGMDEATRRHVFEPFFTTKPEGKGTGLGLATVYGIVKQSGGYIWVDSQVGHGSRFEILLPRVGVPVQNLARKAPQPQPLSGSETVLLAEDDVDVRRLAEEGLTDLGYHVLSAADGPSAIALINAHIDSVDLVLADLAMPGASGFDLAAHARRLRPSIKVLFMSGNPAVVPSDIGLLPDTPLVQKPFTPSSLAGRMRAVLDGVRL